MCAQGLTDSYGCFSRTTVVGVLVRHEGDLRALRQLRAVDVTVLEFADETEALNAVAARNCTAFIVEASADNNISLPLLLDGLKSRTAMGTVIRSDLSPRALRNLTTLDAGSLCAAISLQSDTSADEDVAGILGGDPRTPDLQILREMHTMGVTEELRILVAALACGKRRSDVARLASACRMPLRTLQWHLSRASLPSAHDLLGWMVTLYTVWRLDVLGWPLKRAAAVAGFATCDALCCYVARHAGARPTSLYRSVGFDALVKRFGEVLSDQVGRVSKASNLQKQYCAIRRALAHDAGWDSNSHTLGSSEGR